MAPCTTRTTHYSLLALPSSQGLYQTSLFFVERAQGPMPRMGLNGQNLQNMGLGHWQWYTQMSVSSSYDAHELAHLRKSKLLCAFLQTEICDDYVSKSIWLAKFFHLNFPTAI